MLLFSTIFEIDQRLTKDDFINLVIEWNQKGHPEGVISGIEWNGERNIRFEDENKCLEIQEYRNKNIIAARFEKREPDGAVWDTDYIMNFSEMKMAIRLDRSYIEEALNVDTYHGMVRLVRIVLAITLGFEAAGAIISFFVFRKDYSPLHAVGISIFHSIAAFNNAGFDNLGGMHNLIPYKDNILLNITTDVLVIVGGIGFLVLVDIVKQKSFKKLCLHSKVAISMTAVLLIGGTLILKATENITWMGAFFQSMTTRTAGFSTYNIGNFSKAGLFAMCILMFIGASPGSTGGGVKTTTIFVMIQALKCMGRKKSAHAFKRSISEENISKAFMITVLSAGILCVATFLMCVFEPEYDFIQIIFEVASALSTAGLSTGITPELGVAARILIILLMFTGRVGAFTLLSVWGKDSTPNARYSEEMISIG